MSVWVFRIYLVLGSIWIGLGIDPVLQGDFPSGGIQLAIGVPWIVAGFLRHKGILPERPSKPPLTNPYQEHLPD